jgi:hypothetical protein
MNPSFVSNSATANIIILLCLLLFTYSLRNKIGKEKATHMSIFWIMFIVLMSVMLYKDSKESEQAGYDVKLIKNIQVKINTFKEYENRTPKISEMYFNKIIPEENLITINKVNKLVSYYEDTPIDVLTSDNQILLNYSISSESSRPYEYCVNIAKNIVTDIENVDIKINDKVINKDNLDNIKDICKKDSANTYTIIFK